MEKFMHVQQQTNFFHRQTNIVMNSSVIFYIQPSEWLQGAIYNSLHSSINRSQAKCFSHTDMLQCTHHTHINMGTRNTLLTY